MTFQLAGCLIFCLQLPEQWLQPEDGSVLSWLLRHSSCKTALASANFGIPCTGGPKIHSLYIT